MTLSLGLGHGGVSIKFCENNDFSLGNIVLCKAHSENIKPVVKTECPLVCCTTKRELKIQRKYPGSVLYRILAELKIALRNFGLCFFSFSVLKGAGPLCT
jgi:hypothetical protein